MATITTDKPQIAEIPTGVEIDPVTLDIIEGALKSTRYEMDAVLFRSAMSPVIREQHDEFPMITDPRGRMVVGQFGAYINEMMEEWDRGIYPGDVILTSDPFKCSASISHTNDWLVLVPIFFDDELVGWSSQFGHQMDAGGPLPGSLPTGAKTIFEEGIIIPPLKIVERGEVQEDVLRLILNNVRNPEMNRADLFAIVAGCRAGEKRVMELCDRFGKETYLAALQALLDRTYEAMRTLIQLAIPEEPQTFVDYVDDDGLGNGPFKMQLTIWREGDHAFFDWSGTDPQALGPMNFYLSEGMFKMFIGIYLIMVNDPQILFNDGFYPLLHVVMPEGSLLSPRFPAALGCRTHALARQFDVLGGALCKNAPELNTAAGYGTSPYMLYSGWDGERGLLLLDGDPLRRDPREADRRRDGRPLVVAALREHPHGVPRGLLPDAHRRVHDGHRLRRPGPPPRRQRRREAVRLSRARRGVDPRRPLADAPLGRPRRPAGRALGEAPQARRRDGAGASVEMRQRRRRAGRHARLPDGRRGGWKDRLDRPADVVARDVSFGLVSRELAKEGYGVVLADDGSVDEEATSAERDRQRAERGDAPAFDFGPSLEDVIASCKEETGLDAPIPATPLRWSPLEPGDEALARVRAGTACTRTMSGDVRRAPRPRQRTPSGVFARSGSARADPILRMRHIGFHGRAGFGRRPALVVVDVNRGFTDPASPLVCDLDDVVGAIAAAARRASARRGCPWRSRRSPTTTRASRRRRCSSTRCPRSSRCRRGAAGRRSTRASPRAPTSRC